MLPLRSTPGSTRPPGQRLRSATSAASRAESVSCSTRSASASAEQRAPSESLSWVWKANGCVTSSSSATHAASRRRSAIEPVVATSGTSRFISSTCAVGVLAVAAVHSCSNALPRVTLCCSASSEKRSAGNSTSQVVPGLVPAVAAVAARGRAGFIESEHDDDDDDVLVLDDDDASSAPSLAGRAAFPADDTLT